MLDAIDATDWAGIPGLAKFYDPDVIAPALRALAGATNLIRAAEAAGPLFSCGLLHDHSGEPIRPAPPRPRSC